jgi:hypothetical protein
MLQIIQVDSIGRESITRERSNQSFEIRREKAEIMKTIEFKRLGILLCAGLLGICAHSQTFQVTANADSGPGSLRDALSNASGAGGGTITFTDLPGPISLLSSLPDIGGNLTILGNGPANTAISGNRTNRIFNVLGGATCSISGLTLQAGIPPIDVPYPVYNGAKAIVNAGALSVSNCFIQDNGAGSYYSLLLGGGGLSSVGSSVVLNSVVFSNNAAYGFSSTLSAFNVMATNCLFIGNKQGDQPPIIVSGDSVFSDTIFSGNRANFNGNGVGGGINAGGNLTLLNCTITNNFGDWSAGGIYFWGNNLTISNCVVSKNSTGERHGGIYAFATNNILIFNSTMSGNSEYDVPYRPGGIALGASGYICLSGCTISSNQSSAGIFPGGTLYLTNCTISGNPGVGIDRSQSSSTVQAVNCTIAYNASGVDNSGPGTFYALNTIIGNNATNDFFGTLTSQGHNLIGNLSTNTIIVGSTTGDIYGVDPLLGPLQNNGGPTFTHALLTGSPAIDAAARAGAPLTDQRGVVRQFGIGVDIGAYESQYGALTNEVHITSISRVDSSIHVRVEGPPGSICTIQASSNLLDWEDVFVSSNGVTGIWDFVDQDAGNHPIRFYRARIDNR